ncbi:MAG: iron-sulfur cluster assembly scaffold protein [Desulfobacula sp.]
MHQDQTDFLNTHSLQYIEMALSTDRIERLADPDGYGRRTGECGDTAEFFLVCKNNILESVSFDVHGCMNTTACCNTVTKMAFGKTIEAAWEITPGQVNRFLETLPEDHFHCAELAVGAFYLALTDIKNRKPEKSNVLRRKP